MSIRTQSMTQGKPFPLLLGFALPLMLGNVFQQMYTMVDTIIVGKALGVGALAALGACDWLNWLVLGMVQGLTQGFAILMAQHFGAEKYGDLRRAVANALWLSVAGAVVLTAASQLTLKPVLMLMQTPVDILPDSVLYLRIIFAGLPAVLAFNLLASILRAMGDGRTPLIAMVVAALTNIVLDLVFVLVFHWGIAGAAAATVLAQVLSGVYCYIRLRSMPLLTMQKGDLKLRGAVAKKLFLLGLPLAFQNAIIAIGGMVVQMVVNGSGVLFIAGFTATNKLYGILEVAATSYGYAMTTYTGQNLGARKLERIRNGVAAGLSLGTITSVVIAAAMLVFGRPILSLFISGTPDEVARTLQVAYHYLAIMSIALPILYLLHVLRAAIQGLGNTVLPMASGIAEFFMRTGTALFLPLVLGEEGIFYAEAAAWIGADIILVISYFVTIKKLARTLGPDSAA